MRLIPLGLRPKASKSSVEDFLEFLAEDMQQRPQAIQALTDSLERSLRAITARTKVDRESDQILGDVSP